MKITKKRSNGESGQVILFIIFVVLFLVLFVGLFISRSLAKHAKVSNGVVNSIQSYYAADTGSENVLHYLATKDPSVELNYGDVITLDNQHSSIGGSSMAVVSQSDGTTLKIDIVGTYKNTSRAIQLYW